MPGANLTRQEAEERASVVSDIHYAVSLDLTKGDETFESHMSVSFAAQPGSATFLDFIGKSVDSVVVNGVVLNPADIFADSRIALSNLQAQNHVEIDATAIYSHTGEGLHRSVDPTDGNIYLYSQFEVPDARRVYTVFDQPDLKAIFDFSVIAPADWEVICNTMPLSVEDIDSGVKRWVFASTPTMSSYLTAFIAGPYAKWETKYANEDGRTIPMRQFARQSLKDDFAKDVDYLFDITKKGFAFYAEQWGVPYPYEKFDQIYVPEYNAGAMENIGAVTIRDSYIFGSKTTGAMKERRVVTVLHELAHMWFGDLVTMKWWNDLWLNESFAEFMSSLCTAEVTDWPDAWATFTSGEKSWGQEQDELPTTHPIVAPINDLNDTYVNFDGITYAKGASVLKQLVSYVGREKFFAGIHNYLMKHAYSNATLDDLLSELEAASGRDMQAWSKQWLEQAGVNTLAVEVDTDDDGVISQLRIRQSAPEDHDILRDHRLKVGFYGSDGDKVVRQNSFELDVTGEVTVVDDVAGMKRPEFILVNDDDLTYAKLRFDSDSLEFAGENLYRFDDALARALVWLSLWDMTRDAKYSAEKFVDVSLKLLSTEDESTTFRYALAMLRITVLHYVAPMQKAAVVEHVATELWKLANAAQAGSDEQFQLVKSYLDYGAGADFESNARGLLDGSISLDGLDIDNNLRWAIVIALAAVGLINSDEIDVELAKKETTENREFAYKAKAEIPTAEAKAWAWNQALNNLDLTNSQMELVSLGFSFNDRADLLDPYVDKYFEQVENIWNNRSFHMASALLEDLYPSNAELAKLVDAAQEWLSGHADVAPALRRCILEETDPSRRALMVQQFNAALN